MAIDPRIPLQANTTIDPSRGIGQLADAIKFRQLMDFRKEQAGRDQKVRDAQIAAAREKVKASGQERMFKEFAVDAIMVRPHLVNGDVQTAKLMGEQRLQRLKERGLDTSHTEQFLSTLETDPKAALGVLDSQLQGLDAIGMIDLSGGGASNSFADKTDLINGELAIGLDNNGDPFAKEISTGKLLRGEEATTRIRAAMNAEAEAERKALEEKKNIKVQETREVELTKDAIKSAGEAFDAIPRIDMNIANLEDAIRAVGDGANTGPIVSMFPSMQQASIELDNIQGRLGLDVVGATTFGALSKGELDLAKEVALPTKLNGPELVEWANRKIAAQKKLRNFLREKAVFLSQGKTRADWANHLKARHDAGNPVGNELSAKPAQSGNGLTDDEKRELEELERLEAEGKI